MHCRNPAARDADATSLQAALARSDVGSPQLRLMTAVMLGATESAASGRILLLEPDPALRASVEALLVQHGFLVLADAELAAAEPLLDQHCADIVILGAARPDADALALCRRIAEGARARVIIVSAAASEVDRVVGLEFGADDFLAKPFSPRELLARVRAIRRRQSSGASTPPPSAPLYVFEGVVFDIARRELRAEAGGPALVLQAGVAELLHAFVQHPGRTLSRGELVSTAGLAKEIDARAVDMRVSRVRQRLRALSRRDVIRTVRGAGYVLDAEVTVRRAPA
jgi:two-component system OmpR family response regulator